MLYDFDDYETIGSPRQVLSVLRMLENTKTLSIFTKSNFMFIVQACIVYKNDTVLNRVFEHLQVPEHLTLKEKLTYVYLLGD